MGFSRVTDLQEGEVIQMRKYASTRDERVTDFVFAERIVVQKDCSGGETFCGKHSCQAIATDKAFCVLQPGGWVVFDFGRELHGGSTLSPAGWERWSGRSLCPSGNR